MAKHAVTRTKNNITRQWLNTRSREQRTKRVSDANATIALNQALKTKSLGKKRLKALKTNHLKENHWEKALERNAPLSLLNN